FPRHAALGTPDFHRVVLHPARLRVMLRQLLLRDVHDPTLPVEQDRPRARRPLVEGEHHLFLHAPTPPLGLPKTVFRRPFSCPADRKRTGASSACPSSRPK